MNAREKAFERAKKKAENVARNPEKVKQIIDSALNKANAAKASSQFQEITDKLQALLRMLKSWLNKEYSVIPWQTIILAFTAIIYFVTPFDAIFDFIPLLGFADDVAVLTAVLASINRDLDKFMEWEGELVQEEAPVTDAVEADFEEVKGGEKPEA
ncbi:YkvA family protein [Prosthecochloris sp. SCSIO W1101]|uniref:YkvA family protein n=1 Tax=Prosthecochloris sp. SCSIO W1101 TaxID=2992242 RepID=UPI00223E7B61|nr:YkvA family protein [Prosthecochloris sp. SCSIO W1101]UZJ41421.1 YkvA family protein [Prosthecochloris sp. SCSIO W1101]